MKVFIIQNERWARKIKHISEYCVPYNNIDLFDIGIWTKVMDSYINSTARLLPLLPYRKKRVTPHRLGIALRKMGFKSWTSFLPGKLLLLFIIHIACKTKFISMDCPLYNKWLTVSLEYRSLPRDDSKLHFLTKLHLIVFPTSHFIYHFTKNESIKIM